jgi:phosphotransferase system enzyme I (PtsI)
MPSHTMIKGVAVSSGIAHGVAFVLTRADRAVPRRPIETDAVDAEIARLDAAIDEAENELVALKKEVANRIGVDEAGIFAAQAMVLRDHSLRDQAIAVVTQNRINIEAAVADVVESVGRSFDQIADAYLRERAADVRDVGRRVLSALMDRDGPTVLDIPAKSILVAHELMPSTTARFDLNHVRAFVTDRGGNFSHTAILARSMRLPAVSGVPDAALTIKTGDHLIVDGVSGMVFVNPDESVRREYDRLEAELYDYKADLQKSVDLPAITLDGISVSLLANVNKFSDTEAACLYNADGIGLYRTEFAFAIRNAFPTEEEQYDLFKRAAQRLHPRKVVFRLLDLGGDKTLDYFPLPASRNPSLGPRGIRLLLNNIDILKQQLRALLRISAEHPISLLLPVVGGLDEVRATRVILDQVKQELTAEGKAFNLDIPVGAMIEVPSAAISIATLVGELDFFSLGTNDLVQYVLAADREEDSMAAYYRPLHPAILRLIHSVAQTTRNAARPLTICGEIAGSPKYTELLLGLGLRAFSVAPGEILEVKNAIRSVSIEAATQLASQALGLSSTTEIEALVAQRRHTNRELAKVAVHTGSPSSP